MSTYQPRETIVHKSPHEPKTIAGVESRMAILNGTMAIALIFGLENAYFIPVAVITHMLLKWLTKKDAQTIQIYTRYRLFGDIYDPWPRRSQKVGNRPAGFSRGMLC